MAKNPFLDFDMQAMQKMMTDMKMPAFDWESILAANRRNMEAFSQANQLAAESAQAIMRRQGEILKGAMDDANRSLTTMLADGSPEDRIARQTDAMKTAFEAAISNYREMMEMASKANAEALGVMSKRVSESLDELKVVLKPPGKK
ncbi:MAG: phasin family protein [Alphaproteobacteria bacterium]|nr:phasin family protein [Alphaproteobacteria bacterium]